MSKTLNLYTPDSHLAGATGSVGLLCEFAPDSPRLQNAERWYEPEELLGSPDAALRVAFPVVSKLLQGAPSIEGFPPLSIFEESLLEQVSYIAQAFHLDRWIDAHEFSACRFVSYSPWLDRLLLVRSVSGSAYSLLADASPLEASRGVRAIRKLWKSRPAPSEFFRRVMPLWSRCISAMSGRQRTDGVSQGGIWFYSTAYTFTRIGLQYEPYFPSQINFLVEDPATGGKRLRELGRDGHWLYAWSRASDIPSASETTSIGERITASLAAVPLADEENLLREVLLKSEWWQHFLTRRLPFALFNNRVLQRWRQSVQPEMIVVGNAGWERALLLQQNREHVPSLLLQHGVMHWVYGVADEPVDFFLLRGPFFQRAVNEKLRRKSVLLNFPELNAEPAQSANRGGRDILFITTPYDVPALFHREDLLDILRSLLRVSHSTRRPLVIRVHPFEKISSYERLVTRLQQELLLETEVGYSQGPGTEEVLARSSVAVLYFSTMFLDCLRHRIPIVSFGWHWFPNLRQFQDERIFHFASDLRSFEDLVRQGIEGRLPVRHDGIEEFLAPTRAEDLKGFFKEMWEARSSAKGKSFNPIA